jgi:hypothetical protein
MIVIIEVDGNLGAGWDKSVACKCVPKKNKNGHTKL